MGHDGAIHPIPETTLAELFAAQAARRPDAVAVVFEDNRLSYAELGERAERLAAQLVERGAGPERLVGVALPRSLDLIVTLLAVHKAGAAYLPLDTGYPADRLDFMIADAAPVVVVSENGIVGSAVPHQGVGTAGPARPDQPAYVIYTSGSTGRPKGVVVSHRAIVNRLLWMQDEYRLSTTDRVLQKTPSSFDVSVWEFFWPLITGATLVVAGPGGHQDPAYLADLIEAERITTVHFVPSMLRVFLTEPDVARCRSLRRVMCSGEALPGELRDRFHAVFDKSGPVLHNLYGPTEAAVDVTYWACAASETGSVPIGRPVWNTGLRVLDAALRPVSLGETGELYLAGVQLARGYLNRPALSAERFVADPFGEPGSRMYRTGDLARRRGDGAVEYLGRIDHQVKIRGFRIELGEVESVLGALSGIGQVAVLARDDRLIAYYVAETAPDPERLRAHLAARLPAYMVPTAFVPLAAMPLTVNGKLDRAALPAPDFAALAGEAAPRTERERLLCRIVAQILGLPRVGVADSFFALGGDSITAVRLVRRLREAGLDCSPRDVFALPTPERLAPVLRPLDQAPARWSGDADGEQTLPLGPLQEGLLLHTDGDTGLAYIVQLLIDIDADIDVDVLRRAANALLSRHSSLRAAFRYADDGTPVQLISSECELPWREVHVSSAGQADRVADEDRARPFDVAGAPLLRMSLLRWGDRRSRLVITVHHLVIDGWSLPILVRELFALYAGADLPPPRPYRDYLAWLATRDRSAATVAWTRALAELDGPTRICPARIDAATPEELTEIRLDERATAALSAFARERGLTLNTVLQCAWAIVLGRLTGREDVVFGATVSGRPADLAGAESMVGLFINTIPVRVRLNPQEPVAATLDRLQEEQAALIEHHHLSLAEIQRTSGVAGELFDTVLVFENYPDAPSVPGVTAVERRDATHYPLRLTVVPGRRMTVRLAYRPAAVAPDLVQDIGTRLERELAAMVADPGRAHPRQVAKSPARSPAAGGTARRRLARDQREHLLCELFADVLELPEVGIDDDFFALGGHSLLAIRVISRIRRAMNVELPIRALFDAPTVARLAARLEQGAAVRPPLRAADRPQPLPLSFAQQRLWFLHRLEGPSPTYNIPFALRVSGSVDVPALRAALGDVVARHESLRTVFPESDGRPYQRMLTIEEAEPSLEVRPIHGDVEARLTEAARHAFALESELPLRAWLFTLGSAERVLLLLVHHIAADEWSVGPLLRDLAAAYAARRAGRTPDWPTLPAQYADYTVWQRDLLDGVLGDQLAFWTETLRGIPEQLDLPYDRPRPATASYRGARVPISVPVELHDMLRALARRCGVSVFMVLHAALAAMLTRLGAGTDIPIGTPVAGRTDAALDELVGFFVNTLVLRTDASGDPSFVELLARVRQTDLAAFEHQDVPFERVVDAVNPARSLARHPLFQVMLVHHNETDAGLDLSGTEAAPEPIDVGVSKVDLTLYLTERSLLGCGIDGVLEYSTDLFDRATVETLVRRLILVLESVVEQPDAPIGKLDLLLAGEQHRPGTTVSLPAATLPELLAAQAKRTPEATAVVFGDTSLSYAELHARADRLAGVLAAGGAGPDRIVAVALPRSLDLVVALLAVLKSGAAYLPVDPDYPAERTAYMLADAEPLCVLTGSEPVDLPDGRAEPRRPDGRDAAYVIYTSGSTGRPKGVVVPHAALLNFLLAMKDRFRLEGTDRLLAVTTVGFDIAGLELYLPLLSGATVVLADRDTVRDPAALSALIDASGTTIMQATPTLWQALLTEQCLPQLAGLRVLVGGEAMPAALAERLVAGGDEVTNLYGPTETTIWSTAALVRRGGGTPPIGEPIWNTRVHVLDAGLRPVLTGVAGELYLGGAGLARGYLGRPDLTAERFVADPFGEPGSRLYRTGDLVRYRPNGILEYLGRTDHQVKIRGFRIEPGEIEAVLAEHPDIEKAVVLARDQRLIAYVVPGGADLRDWCAARLPDYMVPAAIVALDALPLTPNGKLDRAALPEPDLAARSGGTAPRTERERVLAAIVAEVLGLPEVGVGDGFFDLGGDSIGSIRLVSRAREAGLAITPRDMFEHKTVEALARHATALEPVSASVRTPLVSLEDDDLEAW